jgi:hypothetical protein
MGGLAEYSLMALGFKYVVLIAIFFYAISAMRLGLAHVEFKEPSTDYAD